MKVRFYIEKRKSVDGLLLTKERPVFMTVAFHGKRAIIATGVKIDMQWWDSNLQRVKIEHPDSFAQNMWLDTLRDTAYATWKALASLSEYPGVTEFRTMFSELRPRISIGFFELFYQFMEENSTHWSYSTYRKVRTIYNHLRDFEAAKSYSLSFNRINNDFLNLFIDYYKEKGNSHTTTLKAINILVWFLNWATDKGFNVFRNYRKFYKLFGEAQTSVSRKIFLNWDELLYLHSFETEDKKLTRVRDLFCLMCFSGIRFSELQNLKRQDVKNDHIVIHANQKKIRIIPMNKYGKEIVERYEHKYFRNNMAFPQISMMTFNKYLRILGRSAGLIEPILLFEGQQVEKLKYQVMTAGVAQNTFISNAVRMDIPPQIITKFTGVKMDSRYDILHMELAKREILKFDLLPDGLLKN